MAPNEDRLRSLESKVAFQAKLLDYVHSAVIATDPEGRITYWNKFAERLYQWRAEEVIGRNILEITAPDSERARAAEILATVLTGPGLWEGEFCVQRKDRSTFLAWIADSVIRGDDGGIAGFVGVSTDITQRKRLEEQLRKTQRHESLGILAGGMAHDFNNLLVGILGNASMLQEMFSGVERARPMFDDLIRASERAADLVGQMLAYAGKGNFVFLPVDLSDVAGDVCGWMRPTIPANIGLSLELRPGLPPIGADDSQIRQIVTNLLLNAVEAIGNEAGEVCVKTGAEAGSVFLEVRDTGCGMDESTKAKIFDPFFSTKFTGRGLGLAAVQGIVSAHKGSLAVRSALGQGSVFRVSFPSERDEISR